MRAEHPAGKALRYEIKPIDGRVGFGRTLFAATVKEAAAIASRYRSGARIVDLTTGVPIDPPSESEAPA